MKKNILSLGICSFLLALLCSCSSVEVDLILTNGKIYTVDSSFSVVEAMAIKDGKIYSTGSSEALKGLEAKQRIDLKGACVYPGLIDAHCHFYGYALDLKKINLTGTNSWQSVLDTLQLKKNQLFMGWLFGRGWDQNDWKIKEFPDKSALDSLFPETPVFLMRIDGHAALVNQKALDMSGVTEKTTCAGGEFEIKNGKLSGLLLDNAVDLVKLKIPTPNRIAETEALMAAQKNCFRVGLTTVDDAGLEMENVTLIDSLQGLNQLKMRYYAMLMLNEKNKNYLFQKGKIKTPRLQVRSFKVYADGALGSRGALMLAPYSDKAGHYGLWLNEPEKIKAMCEEMAEKGFQLNIHCIGDSANRTVLKYFEAAQKGKTDGRWRIEHVQVLNPQDIPLFKKGIAMPSVQPTHATSDMYWAAERIGTDRLKHAYAYRRLVESYGMVAAGSDFPVEDINPLYGFYAAVSRKDKSNFPEKGFQKEDALSRQQALRAMTIWAAYSNFEELEKGSLEAGKYADFVVLKEDLMTTPEEELWKLKIRATYVNGEEVFHLED